MKKPLLLVSLLMISNAGVGMSIFDVGKVCTFSQISGVILNHGEPVKNTIIVRRVDYQGDSEDETRTDDMGHFTMPSLFERSVTKLLPQEFVVGQSLLIQRDGELVEFHMGVKRKPEENVEGRGKALEVTCELTDEKVSFYVGGNAFVTKCKWEVEHDVIDTGF